MHRHPARQGKCAAWLELHAIDLAVTLIYVNIKQCGGVASNYEKT